MVLFIALPLYWLIISSFKTPAALGASPPQYWPNPWSGANYAQAFKQYDFGIYFRNSLIVTLVATALVLVLATMAGYALGRLPMRGKFTLMVTLLMISLFPEIAVIAPLYTLLKNLGWLNTYQAPDHPVHGVLPAVRHLDHAQLHARHPQGNGRDRADRRRRANTDGVDDHPADGPAGRVHGRRSSPSPRAGPSS